MILSVERGAMQAFARYDAVGWSLIGQEVLRLVGALVLVARRASTSPARSSARWSASSSSRSRWRCRWHRELSARTRRRRRRRRIHEEHRLR